MLLRPGLERKDEGAQKIIAEGTDDIAFALSHVVHLLHPDVVIIGGGLSLLGDELNKAIEEKLPSYIMKAFLPPPPIQLATLKQDVVPIGALLLGSKAINLNHSK